MPGGLGGGGSAPAGASSNFPGSSAQVYTPTGQPSADQLFQMISGITPNANSIPNVPSQTPAGQVYPNAQNIFNSLLNPGFVGGPAYNALGQAYTGALGAAGLSGNALGGANSIFNQAFDPQQALYNQTLNQVQQQSAAGAANSGLAGTPYAGTAANNALSNFNLGWQNQQLQREMQGGQAAQQQAQGAATLAGLPLSTVTAAGNNTLQGATQLANLGNNQYMLPQQVLNDLQSYLGLGQASSQISGQLGNLGVQQSLAQQQLQMQQLQGLGSGLGGLTSLATGGQGLSSLFGGSSAAAGFAGGSALDAAAPSTAFDVASALPALSLSGG